MAGNTATLTVKIVSDASQAARGFDQAESRVAGFQRNMDRASVAAGGALLAIGGLAKASFDAASGLQQATGAVEAVFGAQAAAVEQLAKGAAQSAGLAQSEYSNFAALIGSQLANMGFAADQVVPKTDALIKMGADLAAQYGGTTADAVSALSSALKGERDPIERYAVSLNQAAIDAKIAALGLDTSTDAAKRNSSATATLAIIAEQTGSALGAFGREANTAAGQQARATAEWENAKAALGEALLPVVSAAAEALAGLAGWMKENAGTVQVLVGVVAGLAAAILLVNGALKAYRAIAVIATAAQWLFNAALLANPLGLIILAIVAIVAAVIIMYNKFQWFRDFVAAIGDFFVSAWQKILDFLGWIRDTVSKLGGAFSSAMNTAAGAVNTLLTPIRWLWDKLQAVWGLIGKVGGAIGGFLFGAPAVPGGVAPAGPAVAGVFGASTAPVYGAGLISPVGGAGPSAGRGPAPAQTVVNVTINGAVDRVGTARQIEGMLRDYGVLTGRARTVSLSRA